MLTRWNINSLAVFGWANEQTAAEIKNYFAFRYHYKYVAGRGWGTRTSHPSIACTHHPHTNPHTPPSIPPSHTHRDG